MDEMSPLHRALDRCYEVFAFYPRPRVLDASPLRDQDILKPLVSLPLRQLDDEQIGPYAGHALTTVGGVDDYRYFLPRILHLATQAQGWPGLDPSLIGEKLKRARWLDWPADEQAAIRHLFEEAWQRALGRHPDEENAEDWLCGMAALDFGVAAALEAFDDSRTGNSALQLASIIQSSVFEPKGGKGGFWGNMSDDNRAVIRTWLLDRGAERLYRALDSISEADLWHIEQALQVLERQRG
ncbi:MAG TPA: hypothetical protein VGV39_20610 [Mesorhizobium sp.]|jgi:hypothetical protein|uniref:hypothetical protein n=1 Tax=Mesorhizobium sp. TaxID=1871066 RepID=UPI002DDDA667|nr:hypothetical protein [Mesorhizobium sp.]HEV2505491.1 hypothetical protein [Mesorhizobium sp.]